MTATMPDPVGREELRQRLAAILAADVVGFTRLMASDERATVVALDDCRDLFRSEIEARGGRVIDMAGDSVLAVFDTATGAVDASLALQTEIAARAAAQPEERRMLYRIGVHLGDIMQKPDATVYGDGVNIAARLESLAPAGGVAVSHSVQATLGGRASTRFIDMGEHEVKNVARPVRVFFWNDDSSPDVGGVSPQPPGPARIGNLPVQPTSLIGRADALDQVASLLDTAPLVTLLGTGGIGKTRLAIETAGRASRSFPDGAWFVDLAAVADSRAVGHAAAGVFGVTQQSGKTIEQSLVDSLGGRRLLLVLDNCEHVAAAAATLAHEVLATCPQVKILATSREALSLSGEHVWPVPSLDVAGDTAPAVELFVARARAVVPSFELGDHGEVVGDICRELDGIPLAIELAAARVRSLSPGQILERLGERFRLLTGGSRETTGERHQTLRHAVQWSYELLSSSECEVLARAAVFAGGFTLEAAEAVCVGGEVASVDVFELLDSLVSKSLLYAELHAERPRDAVRFGMLETIRSFAAERLAEASEHDLVRRQHAEFYASQSGETFEAWRSPRELEAYEWLDLEINNLRIAFRWAIDHEGVDIAARIASDVGDMGRFRLREEAANWAEEVVEAARIARHPRLAVLLTWCASSAWAFSRFDDAQRFGEEALALRDDPAFDPFIWAYGDLAFVALFAGDIDRAIELLRTGAEHPTDRLDRFMLAFLLYIMATTGHADEALHVADDIVQDVDAAGVPMSIAVAYGGKGAALEATDPSAALVAYEHSIGVARQSGNRFMETLIAPRLAALHARSGEPMVALQGFERMLVSFGEATDIASVSAWRTSLVVLLAKLGYFEAAATLHGTLPASIDAKGVIPEQPEAVGRVCNALGEPTFNAAVASGAEMSLREASNYAIEQVRLVLTSLDTQPRPE